MGGMWRKLSLETMFENKQKIEISETPAISFVKLRI